MASLVNSINTKHLKRSNSNLSQTKKQKEEDYKTHLMSPALTLLPKPDKKSQENYVAIPLINIKTKMSAKY